MKLHTILFLCVLVLQKVSGESENGNETDDVEYIEGEVSSEVQSKVNITNKSTDSGESRKLQNDSSINFSADLYQEVKKSQPQNFVLSPLSLTNALAMVSLGAAGETAEEILKSLESQDNNQLIRKQSNLTSLLKGISSQDSGVKFVTADKIYANSELSVKIQYEKDVKKLGGEIETVDFGNGEEAAEKINAWVNEKTEGKIANLVDSSALNSQISLFVLNTIYFKGAWENQFNVSKTKKAPFFINGSCSVSVEMMFQQSEFHLADLEDANAQVILLPYKGGRLSMMIYLPYGNDKRALEILENWLKDKSPFDIQKEYFDELGLEKVSVSLPKFKIRSSLELNEPLKKLGLEKMFDSALANFSGIFNDAGDFFVSKVSQETFIEVNEEGTEAAAATGFEVTATSFPPEFTADRPFLFQIVDSETKTVLFSGRVKNPLDSLSPSDSAVGSSQCVEASLLRPQTTDRRDEGNGSCVSKPEMTEMLLDFLKLLAPNFTETSSTSSRASGFEELMEKYGNETGGAERILQSMSITLDRLEKFKNQTHRIQELEAENEKLKNSTAPKTQPAPVKPPCHNGHHAAPKPTNTPRPNSKTDRKTVKEETEQCVCFPTAAARIIVSDDYDYDFWTYHVLLYNATVDGICWDFYRDVESVHLTGSCVTLYKDEGCSGKEFRLHKRNRILGRDIQQQFLSSFWRFPKSPKSIGPCW